MKIRNIYISSPAQLSYQLGFLFIQKKYKRAVQIPLKDINTIILDNSKINITCDVISNLSYHNVDIIWCNYKHMPCSINYQISQNCDLESLKAQLRISKQIKGRIWKRIIKRKIYNQAYVLYKNKKIQYQILLNLSHQVKIDDKTHREANSARIYFKSLFGDKFKRRIQTKRNICLNYGYSLIRSMICRSIIKHYLVSYLGIWHHSNADMFMLSDDLIEPFRAIVDLYIIQRWKKIDKHKRLMKSDRIILLKLLTTKVNIDNKKILINKAIDIMVESYRKCIMQNSSKNMLMPNLWK